MTKAGDQVRCAECGDHFQVKKGGLRAYCSEFCRDAAQRVRKRELKRKERAKAK